MSDPIRAAAEDPGLEAVLLCKLCRQGAGGECHTPGCGLWGNRAPDIPVALAAEPERGFGSELFDTTERLAKAAFANQECQYKRAVLLEAVQALLAKLDRMTFRKAQHRTLDPVVDDLRQAVALSSEALGKSA